MSAICLLSFALALGQSFDRVEWSLVPQFDVGLELVYRGTCTEESLVPGVRHQRRYSLETIFLVQTTNGNRSEAVLQTTLSVQQPNDNATRPPGSVRLVAVQVDQRGRLYGKGDRQTEAMLSIPLTEPALLESGAFFEMPMVPVNMGSYWEDFEEGRPIRGWRLWRDAKGRGSAVEQLNGTRCVKLQASQQSADWDEPRADSTAWRRLDVIWFAPQVGLVYQVERTIERREPARNEPTQRIVTRYELESRLRYSGKMFEDRKLEIDLARKFHEDAQPLLKQPANSRNQIEALSRRIAKHLEDNPPTPYRKNITHLKSLLEKASRGETPAGPATVEQPFEGGAVGISHKVPDFVVADLLNRKSYRFYNDLLLGQPVLFLYYNPTTATGKEVLRFAQKLHEEFNSDLLILGMAVSDNVDRIAKQVEEMGVEFPILDGKAMHRTLGVDGTPRVVLVDSEAVVRFCFTGWGVHSPGEVRGEVEKCLQAEKGKTPR